MDDDVMIAVDPHKASNTLAVMDPVTRTRDRVGPVREHRAGYRAAAARSPTGGPSGAGRSRVVTGRAGRWRSGWSRDGEPVLDVPAKLAARVRVYSQGHGRKTDRDDAISVGLAALDGDGVLPVPATMPLVEPAAAVRPARGTRRAAHPGGVPAAPAAGRAHPRRHAPRADGEQGRSAARPASARPMTWARSGCICAREHLADIRALDAKIEDRRRADRRPGHGHRHRPDRASYGVGPVIAGRILAEAGRRRPVPDQGPLRLLQRHRADRRVLRRPGPPPAVPRREPADQPRAAHDGRHPDPPPQHRRAAGYYERKRPEGKTPKEALRCLKRRLSDVVYRQLVADQRGTIEACGSPTTRPPTRSTSTSPSRAARAGPHHLQASHARLASKGSSRSTGKTTASSASRSSTPAPGSTATSSTMPKPSAKTAAS